jgi:hypothetical protein
MAREQRGAFIYMRATRAKLLYRRKGADCAWVGGSRDSKYAPILMMVDGEER